MVLAALGILGDLLSGQRITLQRIFERVRRVELELGVPPSHYEPGASRRPARSPPRARAPAAAADRGARGAEGMSAAITRDAEGTVTGNTYDKYGSTNPVVKRLMAGFERTLDELFASAAPRSMLDVGCGEGVLTHKWAQRLDGPRRRHRPRGPGDPGRVGEAPGAEPRVPRHEGREPAVRRRRVRRSRARSRCSSTCPTPSTPSPRWRACARRHLLVSVPREPLWRGLNMARGAYLKDLGNTPGHVNHWSKRTFVRAAVPARRGRRGALAVPVDDAARPRVRAC